MPRLAHIADSHFDASDPRRFAECIAVHGFIADDLAKRAVDLVLHAGDIYERASTPLERAAVVQWVLHVTAYAPLLIIRGNHDAHRDLEILSELHTAHPVIVEEGAGVHCVAGFVVGCLAWPTKAGILAMDRLSHLEGERVAQDALRNVLLGLGQQMDEVREARGMQHAPKVLLAHAMVRGCETSTGQPLVGCDFELGLEDLALARADYVALGHIHMPQDWPPHVVFPGSPRRTAFGEVEDKGYVVADVFDGFVEWQRVQTPCAPMLLIEDEWGCEEGSDHQTWLVGLHGDPDPTKGGYQGAEVRFRYTVPADMREAARAAAADVEAYFMKLGAARVKTDPIVRTNGSARAPEVAQAKTIGEKLHALWKARAAEPDPERAERLIGKANNLERAG